MEPTKETALRKHLSTLTITTIALLLVFSAVFYFFPQWYFKVFPVLFLSEVIVFFVVDYLFINNVTNKGKNFIVQHKLATTIKFFVLLMVLSTFLLFNKQDSIKIAVVFISLFFVFLAVQTISFLKIFKNK
jgi:hypothetical protein